MSATTNFFNKTPELADTTDNSGDQVIEDVGIFNSLSETETMGGDSGWEEVDDDEESGGRNRKGYTMAERRQMPSRASKESSLLGIKRRTIMKPSKRTKTPEDFQNLKPAEIRKIYLNKKLTNFKPSSLETIFEEAPSASSSSVVATKDDQDYLQRLMGARKIRRTLACTDGFRHSKTLVNKRRAKIKKTFGKRFALKKISLEEFITKLNSSIEKNEEDDCDGQCGATAVIQQSQEVKQENSTIGLTAGTQISSTEMFASNNSTNLEDDDMMPINFTMSGVSTNNFTTNMSL